MPDQRGVSMSVFACGAILVLLIMAGLLVDGAAQLMARQRVEDSAAQVARFAMDAAAPYMVDGQNAGPAALAAASKAAKRHTDLSFEFMFDATGALHVSATKTVPTQFLCLIGIKSLQVRGQAIAIVFQP